jgi:hypothetical protein
MSEQRATGEIEQTNGPDHPTPDNHPGDDPKPEPQGGIEQTGDNGGGQGGEGGGTSNP